MEFYTNEPVRSVYVHWPFCPYKCHFCPFVALASQDQFMAQYHSALMAEIAAYKNYPGVVCDPLKTVYCGGGTPSTYPNELLLDMLGTLRTTFGIEEGAEVSIEVNPGTVRPGQLAFWRSIGVNRLSIGVQSLNDAVLKKLNRHQLVSDVTALVDQAAPMFDSLSIDLIVGLPGVSHEEWYSTIEQVTKWPIQHVSVYFLTVHEDTPLYFKAKKKEVVLEPDDALVDLYMWTREQLVACGFEHYEVSNFARPGYESKHNSVYWQRKPYKAFGLGACSFDGVRRIQNEKNLMRYMQAAQQGDSVAIFSEKLTREQVHLERVMLGLRQKVGLLKEHIFIDLKDDEYVRIAERVKHLEDAGFIKNQNERLVLTDKGIAVENAIAAHLSL